MTDRSALPQHVTVAQPVALAETAFELPLVDYDAHSAAYIVASLRGLSQSELRAVDQHELRSANRIEVRDRVAELMGDEPWIGYDGQDVQTITQFLGKSGSAQAREVHAYERAHRDRAGIMQAAQKRLASKPA